MSQQPEALRLARELEGVYPVNIQDQEAAAAELRRLHDENQKLRAGLERQTIAHDQTLDQLRIIDRQWNELYRAIQKLHAAKGRYHTQIAICDLFDLVGAPNERPKK